MVQYKYDAWGGIRTEVNDETHAGIAELNPFRYRSYYYDPETNLYYLNTRYYDPEVGRFISQDDVSYLDPEHINGLNLFAYCGNNPVSYIDSDGQSPKWWQWLLFGIGAALVVATAVVLIAASGGTALPGVAGAIALGAAKGALIGAAIGTAFGVAGGAIYSTVTGADMGDSILQGFLMGFGIGAIAGAVVGGVYGAATFTPSGLERSAINQAVKNTLKDPNKMAHIMQGKFSTYSVPISKDKPVTPLDFYIMHMNDKSVYCKAMDANAVSIEDAYVYFDDGQNYKINKAEIYNSGKTIVTTNGERTVQEKDVNKNAVVSTYNDSADKSFQETYEYNDIHKRIKSTDYRNIVAQNTFGDTEITSAMFPVGGTQKIINSQEYSSDKNHVLCETDDRHTDSEAIKRSYEYNTTGQIIKCTLPDGSIVHCDYDIYTGLPTRIYSNIGGVAVENKYTYFKGLLVKIEVNNVDNYTFKYDGYGNLADVYYNGTLMSHEYINFSSDYSSDYFEDFNFTEKRMAGVEYKTYFDRYGKVVKTMRGESVLFENQYDSNDKTSSIY